jgi:hypothetical protein
MAGLTFGSLLAIALVYRSLIALDVDAAGLITSRLRLPARLVPRVVPPEQPVVPSETPL